MQGMRAAASFPCPPSEGAGKKPHDIAVMMRRLRRAVRDLPDAAMFELRERGHGGVFAQLVACIISIRTRDEVSLPAAVRLLDAAPTAADVARLPASRIEALIAPAAFREAKALQIRDIARRAAEEFGGELPPDYDVLTSFKGVGPKCANLALGIAADVRRIAVDVHVHRVTNRWGYVRAATPEKTMAALEKVLPRRYWIEINRLLVPFGKHICTGARPKCSQCPVWEYCRQVGVTRCR